MVDLINLSGVRKSFAGVKALRGVDFSLKAGEVHALVGENGAGKSTLMRVLGGDHIPDAGEICMDGEVVHFRSPKQALARGVKVIHQELALANDLSVAENIFLSELPQLVSWPALNRKAQALINRLGFDIRPNTVVRSLSVAHQQVVEIAKALSHEARVIVFDEPTAVLSGQDADHLLTIIEGLRDAGVGIVYVTHRLEEVFRVADRITVLKDGSTVGTVDKAATSTGDLIRMMIGRPLSAQFGRDVERTPGKEILRVEKMSRGERVRDASLSVRAGEIVGLGGLVGAGRTDLARLIFGADRSDAGHIYVDGKEITVRKPGDAVKAGIGLMPESRKDQGLVMNMSIRINTTLAKLGPLVNPFGLIRYAAERKIMNDLGTNLRIKAASYEVPVSSLSGGNQQKVVLAKWLHAGGRILILDEPTRGVDVGAKTQIYSLIKSFAAAGNAVLVISSEHLELFGLCDRILVMREGWITGELQQNDYSEENLLKLAMTASLKAAAEIGAL